MTRLWWVRHGPTHVRRMVGWTDVPADLSNTARLQALRTALPDAPVISSDLLRARQTAAVLDRPLLPESAALREFHFGDWENRAFDDIEDPALRRYFETPGAQRAPNGESWNDVTARVSAEVERLCAPHSDVILVAHMGPILTQWARATGLSPYETLSQKIVPLSITRIDWEDHTYQPVFVNHQPD